MGISISVNKENCPLDNTFTVILSSPVAELYGGDHIATIEFGGLGGRYKGVIDWRKSGVAILDAASFLFTSAGETYELTCTVNKLLLGAVGNPTALLLDYEVMGLYAPAWATLRDILIVNLTSTSCCTNTDTTRWRTSVGGSVTNIYQAYAIGGGIDTSRSVCTNPCCPIASVAVDGPRVGSTSIPYASFTNFSTLFYNAAFQSTVTGTQSIVQNGITFAINYTLTVSKPTNSATMLLTYNVTHSRPTGTACHGGYPTTNNIPTIFEAVTILNCEKVLIGVWLSAGSNNPYPDMYTSGSFTVAVGYRT